MRLSRNDDKLLFIKKTIEFGYTSKLEDWKSAILFSITKKNHSSLPTFCIGCPPAHKNCCYLNYFLKNYITAKLGDSFSSVQYFNKEKNANFIHEMTLTISQNVGCRRETSNWNVFFFDQWHVTSLWQPH